MNDFYSHRLLRLKKNCRFAKVDLLNITKKNMLTLILITVAVILLTVGIVWVIDKFVPTKLKPVLMIGLWALIIFLGYLTFMSVYGEIKFNQVKEKRYAKVIENLIDIRDSELAYRERKGKFTNNYNELINFIENGKFIITQRRDSTVLDEVKTKAYGGVESFMEITIVDTLDQVSVKDSLFKTSTRYKTMMNVPFAPEGTKYTLKAGQVGEEGDKEPVFEASVLKKLVLHDQEPDYLFKENEVVSVEEIDGNTIRVGSMEEVKVIGNWPKLYDVQTKK